MNALRAFEAVGRTGSLTAAAAELGVTPGAISRQLHILEDFVRAELFVRDGRRLTLSAAARAYADMLSDLFARIDQESRLLAPTAETSGLLVSAAPSFAMRWLAPRLSRFREAYPSIEIHLRTLANAPAIAGERFDLAVTTGPGPWPGFKSQLLFKSPMVPVCSPAFLTKNPRVAAYQVLSSGMMIHVNDRRNDWSRWCKLAGRTDLDTSRGMVFENSNLAYQATLEGMGIMIAHRPLVETDFSSGRLSLPFDVTIADEPDYFVLYPEQAERRSPLTQFRNWLHAEATRDALSRTQPATLLD